MNFVFGSLPSKYHHAGIGSRGTQYTAGNTRQSAEIWRKAERGQTENEMKVTWRRKRITENRNNQKRSKQKRKKIKINDLSAFAFPPAFSHTWSNRESFRKLALIQ